MYYYAKQQDTLPYLTFDYMGETTADRDAYAAALGASYLASLVVTESQLTDDQDPNYISYQFGICHKRIFNNALADRPQQEIDDQQDEFLAAKEIIKAAGLENVLFDKTFFYDGKNFPLTTGSRGLYEAIFNSSPGDHVLITTKGNYTLAATDISDFKTSYYDAVLELKQEYSV